jgi:acetolactate decarboxylase
VRQTAAMLDERWIRSLHVEAMHHADLHGGHDAHVLFQSSTIGALLEGAYEGDMTFAELAEQGDLGLGTLDRLDGEMIALDGRFYRADVEGVVHDISPQERTPFAVVSRFEPRIRFDMEGPLAHDELLAAVDERMPEGAPSGALRVDGLFDVVRARSVPCQVPPYRPLAEVVGKQHVFELEGVEGTMVGFRFPDYAEGIEVGGYHLHFITADRRRGGHVLDARATAVRVALDPSRDLHVELPPGMELRSPDLAADTHAAIVRAESGQ